MPSAPFLLLLGSELRRRPARHLAAIVAISLAASVLLTSLAGLHAASEDAPLAGSTVLPDTDVHLRADDPAHPYLDADLLGELSRDPRVASVQPARRIRVIDQPGTAHGALDVERFHGTGPGGGAGWGPQGRTTVWAWRGEPPMPLADGRWPEAGRTDPIELVVPGYRLGDRVQARHPLDEWRLLEGDTGLHAARVVGVVDAGMWSSYSRRMPAFLVDEAAAEALAGPAFAPSDARVRLRDAADVPAFLADHANALASAPGHPRMWDRRTLVEGHEDSFTVNAARSVARTSLLLAACCVLCIVLSTLGSSVRERAAQYRLLRTIGTTRATIVALVLAESLVLAAAGLLGAVLLAWAAIAGLAPLLPFLSLRGGPPGADAVATTGLVVAVAVLAGSAWPAWLATRGTALHAREQAATGSWRFACTCAAAALLTAALGGLLVVTMSADGTAWRAGLLAWIGVPTLAVVAALLTPLALRLASLLLLRPIAALLRTDPALLDNQFRGDEPRSMSSVMAMSVGLGAFLMTLSWGASMLGAFVIDERVPRWLVSVHPYGLDEGELDGVLARDALRDLQPLALVDTRVGDAAAIDGDEPADLSCLVCGVDAARAFAPASTALPFRFVEGDPLTAADAVANGEGCVVNDWFAMAHNLHVGDTVPVVVPGRGTVDGRDDARYRIAGVADLHGWRMVFKHNKTRQRNFKQQALVVLARDVVRRDFRTAACNYLIGDAPVDAEYPPELPLRQALGVSRGSRAQVEAEVAAAVDLRREHVNQSDAVTTVTATSRAILVDDLDRTRHVLRTDWGGKAVKALGWLPLLALILSLLPVAATMIAAMLARSRELGVLRSCGLSRAALLRMVLGEAALVGVAAVLVAALFGSVGAWLLLEVAHIVGYHMRFVGIQPDLVVPWSWLLPGWLLTVAVCAGAALLAAWRVGRRPPAALLAPAAAA